MNRRSMVNHTLVLLATLVGVVGMGTVFSGAMHGSVHEISRGIPLLLIGLCWAGRELGKSMLLSRARK